MNGHEEMNGELGNARGNCANEKPHRMVGYGNESKANGAQRIGE